MADYCPSRGWYYWEAKSRPLLSRGKQGQREKSGSQDPEIQGCRVNAKGNQGEEGERGGGNRGD